MQINTCIRELTAQRGKSLRWVSMALGKAVTWASNVSLPTRSPALATVVDIADVLGYDVTIVDRETGVAVGTIAPSRRQGENN